MLERRNDDTIRSDIRQIRHVRHGGKRVTPLLRFCGIPHCRWLSFVEKTEGKPILGRPTNKADMRDKTWSIKLDHLPFTEGLKIRTSHSRNFFWDHFLKELRNQAQLSSQAYWICAQAFSCLRDLFCHIRIQGTSASSKHKLKFLKQQRGKLFETER